MAPIVAALLPALKHYALRAVTHKIVKETSEEMIVRVANDKPVPLEMSKKKLLTKTGPIWTLLVTALLTFLSAKGYVDPAWYQLIETLLMSPEVMEAVNEAVTD